MTLPTLTLCTKQGEDPLLQPSRSNIALTAVSRAEALEFFELQARLEALHCELHGLVLNGAFVFVTSPNAPLRARRVTGVQGSGGM